MSNMPEFATELVFPEAFGKELRKRIGKLYLVQIAPLDDASGDISWPAYYDPRPNSRTTFVGKKIAEIIGLDTMGDKDKWTLSLRDLGNINDYQIDIKIGRRDIEKTTGRMSAYWIKIGFKSLDKQLDTQDCSDVGRKKLAILRQRKGKKLPKCYDRH